MLRRKFASLGLVALLALAGVACNGGDAETDGAEDTEATDGAEDLEATEEGTE